MNNRKRVVETYYIRNRDRILPRQKAWHKKKYASDPEYRKRQIIRSKIRYWNNREEALANARKWRLENPDKIAKYVEKARAKYFASKPPKIKTTKAEIKAKREKKQKIFTNVQRKIYPVAVSKTSRLLNEILSNKRMEEQHDDRKDGRIV
jgi:hypothetical protein